MENDHKDLYMLLGSNHYYIKTTIYFFFKEKKIICSFSKQACIFSFKMCHTKLLCYKIMHVTIRMRHDQL